MTDFGPLPSFEPGQVFSAEYHGNLLQNVVQGLKDGLSGFSMPFLGNYWSQDMTSTYGYSGYIRHKWDTFRYRVTLMEYGTTYVKINGETVAELFGISTHSGDVDISSLGLAVNEFYTVTVENDNHQIVWDLREIPGSVSLPSLVSFADGTTPTAAEWQDLSNYAEILAEVNSAPVAPLPFVDMPASELNERYPFAGVLQYNARYLSYRIYVKSPYNADEDGHRYAIVRLWVDDTLVAKFVVGKQDVGPDGGEYYEFFSAPRGTGHTFDGLLDLETYPGGLSFGSQYYIYCKLDTAYQYDWYHKMTLERLILEPESGASLAGWTAMTPWSHEDLVDAAGTPPGVMAIKDNLELLGGLSMFSNAPSCNGLQGSGDRYFGKRKWRWLFYRTEEGSSAKITYFLRGSYVDVSLPNPEAGWHTVDLDGIDSFYVGTNYTLSGVENAIEDNVLI